MSIKSLETLFQFIGGLGMFLYGMNIMADGLQKSAGKKMKQLLGFLTNNRLIAVIVGALVTGIIQSSSATTVMVVGFVNAGIINLTQAVGVIMGANIGTTITSWLVSMSEWGEMLKPEFIAPLFIGIGAFIILFAKKARKKEIGEILVGFGILFIGLSFMSNSIKPYKDSQIFVDAFTILGRNPLLGILAGAVVTGIIQSSSASVGILQTLAMNGIVNWKSAIFITLGQNIGTCVTAILSCAGANKTAKRAAAIHLLFNTIGAVLFGILMYIIFLFNKELAASSITSTQISIFHTIFNVTNTIILFPFANLLVKASALLVRGKDEGDEKDEVKVLLRHLDERILETPSFAVENAIKEVVHMGEVAKENVNLAIKAVLTNNMDKAIKVIENESVINNMEAIITEYLVKISNLSLTEKQHETINHLFYTISDIERVGDHCENIAEFAVYKINNDLKFSEIAISELEEITSKVYESFSNAIDARKFENVEFIRNVVKLEDMVDELEEDLREKHIQRLSLNQCDPKSGIVFLDLISNLERISDHSQNIANYIRDELD